MDANFRQQLGCINSFAAALLDNLTKPENRALCEQIQNKCSFISMLGEDTHHGYRLQDMMEEVRSNLDIEDQEDFKFEFSVEHPEMVFVDKKTFLQSCLLAAIKRVIGNTFCYQVKVNLSIATTSGCENYVKIGICIEYDPLTRDFFNRSLIDDSLDQLARTCDATMHTAVEGRYCCLNIYLDLESEVALETLESQQDTAEAAPCPLDTTTMDLAVPPMENEASESLCSETTAETMDLSPAVMPEDDEEPISEESAPIVPHDAIAAAPSSDATESTTTSTLRRDKQQVLLLEDNKIAQRITQVRLEDMGFKVEVAGTVAAAVEYLNQCHRQGWLPYMMLLDIRLPDGHGGEVALYARSLEDQRQCKLVAVTTHSHAMDSFMSQHQIDRLIVKPLSDEDMTELLKHYFSQEHEQLKAEKVVTADAVEPLAQPEPKEPTPLCTESTADEISQAVYQFSLFRQQLAGHLDRYQLQQNLIHRLQNLPAGQDRALNQLIADARAMSTESKCPNCATLDKTLSLVSSRLCACAEG